MSEHADEPIDQDPLFEFANEPGPIDPAAPVEPISTQSVAHMDVAGHTHVDEAAAASSDALNLRLDRLEQADERATEQLSLLRAQVATLVAAIDDIKKREARRATYAAPLPHAPIVAGPRSRPRRAIAGALGIVAGIAIAVVGWMTWQGDSVAVADAPPAAVMAESPARIPAEAPAPIEDVAPAPPAQPAITLASTTGVQQRPTRKESTREMSETRRADTAYIGALSIDASPGGAVLIDRKPAGQTPLVVTGLKAGSHLVWIERDGYRRFTRVVEVPADRVSRVFADLERLTP